MDDPTIRATPDDAAGADQLAALRTMHPTRPDPCAVCGHSRPLHNVQSLTRMFHGCGYAEPDDTGGLVHCQCPGHEPI
jgi:hypothetical protein